MGAKETLGDRRQKKHHEPSHGGIKTPGISKQFGKFRLSWDEAAGMSSGHDGSDRDEF